MLEYGLQTSSPAAREDAAYKSWENSGRKMVMRTDLLDRTAGPIPSFGSMVHKTALAAQEMNYAPSSGNSAHGERPDISYDGEKEAFEFGDIIDMINPLQHLPVVGMIYRKLSGDTIKPFSNIIGGAIFGGPVGAVSSTVNAIVKDRTGKDVAENAFAAIGINIAPEGAKKPDIQYAASQTARADLSALEGTTLAVANLSQTKSAKNFAAVAPRIESYNG